MFPAPLFSRRFFPPPFFERGGLFQPVGSGGPSWVPPAKPLAWAHAGKPLTWTPAPRVPMALTPLPKDPSDVLPFSMNFGLQPELIGGDSITACSVAAAAQPGFSGSLSCSTVTVNGPVCTAVIAGGSDGNDYNVRFTASLLAPGGPTYTRVLGGLIQVRAE